MMRYAANELAMPDRTDTRERDGQWLLIAGGDGLQFRVKDTTALDKHSRRLLERPCRQLVPGVHVPFVDHLAGDAVERCVAERLVEPA